MTSEKTEIILVDRPIEHVALLTINRPEVMNALSIPVRLELAKQLNALEDDDDVRVVVLAGQKRAFAAGADLKELQQRTIRDATTKDSRAAWTALQQCTKPVIAAVNGFALGGGCELALHCDIVVAGESARFGLPEVKVGIMPGAGGTQRFLRTAGKFKASRYLLTGDFISATVANQMGLVSDVVPDGDVLPHSLTLAAKIAALPPLAVRAIKEVIALGPDASLDAALALERKAFQILFTTEDRNEGIAAFLEKRKPVFKGL